MKKNNQGCFIFYDAPNVLLLEDIITVIIIFMIQKVEVSLKGTVRQKMKILSNLFALILFKPSLKFVSFVKRKR